MDKVDLMGNLALTELYLLGKRYNTIELIGFDIFNENHLGVLYIASILQKYVKMKIRIDLKASDRIYLQKIFGKDFQIRETLGEGVPFEAMCFHLDSLADEPDMFAQIYERSLNNLPLDNLIV